LLVDRAHHLADWIGGGVGALFLLLFHRGGDFGDRLPRFTAVHGDHGRLLVDGADELDRFRHIDGRIFQETRRRGDTARAVDENGVTVRLRAHEIFGRDIAERAGLVFD